ncbi:MAG: hypothetical protein JNL62_04575 [Bryobacterales bacterium]|nr:hypothetical protein [Bryobacterales bacterium]
MTTFPLPLLSIAVLAPVVGAIAVARTGAVRLARLLAMLSVLTGLAASLAALWLVVPQRGTMAEPWEFPLLGAAAPLLAADTLGCLALSLIASLALFTITLAPRRDLERRELARMLLLLAAISLAYSSNHLLLLLGGWGLASMLVATVSHKEADGEAASRATLLMRIVLTGGFGALAAAVFLLGREGAAAGLLSPYALHLLSKTPMSGGEVTFALLMMAVLFTKGIFPFHSWVVTAFDRGSLLTSNLFVSAHLGAFVIAKVAIPVMPFMARRALPLLSDVALFTMCYMAVLAVRERSPRRILALLFVGQASSILVGLESATEAGVTGALVHWMVVAVAVTSLASVLRLLEVRVGSRLGTTEFLGLANRFPRLAVFFLIAGLALVGLPGTLGFCAEDLLIHGTLESHPQLGVALPVATALFAFHMLRLFSKLFLGRQTAGPGLVPDAVARERVGLTALIAFLVLFGIAPEWIVDRQASAAIPLVEELRIAQALLR